MKPLSAMLLLSFFLATACSGQTVFLDESFDGGLSAWANPGWGVVVFDPLDLTDINWVLAFTRTGNTGDLFSPVFTVEPGATYVLSFRYLGHGGGADTGGYLWLYDPALGIENPGNPVWGTQPENCDYELIDDGQWHTYTLQFTPADLFGASSGEIVLTLEDWDGAAGSNPPPNVAGDAFFDDIQLYQLGAVEDEGASLGKVKALYR